VRAMSQASGSRHAMKSSDLAIFTMRYSLSAHPLRQ